MSRTAPIKDLTDNTKNLIMFKYELMYKQCRMKKKAKEKFNKRFIMEQTTQKINMDEIFDKKNRRNNEELRSTNSVKRSNENIENWVSMAQNQLKEHGGTPNETKTEMSSTEKILALIAQCNTPPVMNMQTSKKPKYTSNPGSSKEPEGVTLHYYKDDSSKTDDHFKVEFKGLKTNDIQPVVNIVNKNKTSKKPKYTSNPGSSKDPEGVTLHYFKDESANTDGNFKVEFKGLKTNEIQPIVNKNKSLSVLKKIEDRKPFNILGLKSGLNTEKQSNNIKHKTYDAKNSRQVGNGGTSILKNITKRYLNETVTSGSLTSETPPQTKFNSGSEILKPASSAMKMYPVETYVPKQTSAPNNTVQTDSMGPCSHHAITNNVPVPKVKLISNISEPKNTEKQSNNIKHKTYDAKNSRQVGNGGTSILKNITKRYLNETVTSGSLTSETPQQMKFNSGSEILKPASSAMKMYPVETYVPKQTSAPNNTVQTDSMGPCSHHAITNNVPVPKVKLISNISEPKNTEKQSNNIKHKTYDAKNSRQVGNGGTSILKNITKRYLNETVTSGSLTSETPQQTKFNSGSEILKPASSAMKMYPVETYVPKQTSAPNNTVQTDSMGPCSHHAITNNVPVPKVKLISNISEPKNMLKYKMSRKLNENLKNDLVLQIGKYTKVTPKKPVNTQFKKPVFVKIQTRPCLEIKENPVESSCKPEENNETTESPPLTSSDNQEINLDEVNLDKPETYPEVLKEILKNLDQYFKNCKDLQINLNENTHSETDNQQSISSINEQGMNLDGLNYANPETYADLLNELIRLCQ